MPINILRMFFASASATTHHDNRKMSYRDTSNVMVVAMKRRDFIRNTGWFVVGAALVPACGSDLLSEAAADETAGAVRRLFPQGVASGDPRPTSVVLWTRVVAASGDTTVPVQLRVQVATDARCLNLVVDHAI